MKLFKNCVTPIEWGPGLSSGIALSENTKVTVQTSDSKCIHDSN